MRFEQPAVSAGRQPGLGRRRGRRHYGGSIDYCARRGHQPRARHPEYYTVADDLHYVRGKHTFSVGGWMQRLHQNEVGAAQSSAGTVTYATMLTLLQDVPAEFLPEPEPGRTRIPVAGGGLVYPGRDQKLFSNFTVRVGLRDEMTNGWNEVTGRCSNYTFDQNFVMSNNPAIGSSCLQQNHAKSLWQPRVGIAWDPTGAETGPYGLASEFITTFRTISPTGVYANAPFNAREQISGSLFSIIPLTPTTALPPSMQPGRLVSDLCSRRSGPQTCLLQLSSNGVSRWSARITKDTMLQVGLRGEPVLPPSARRERQYGASADLAR